MRLSLKFLKVDINETLKFLLVDDIDDILECDVVLDAGECIFDCVDKVGLVLVMTNHFNLPSVEFLVEKTLYNFPVIHLRIHFCSIYSMF